MKKLLTTILILAAFSAHLSAQVYFEDEDDTVVTPPPQVYFGGNFSMNFGGLGGGQDGFLELSPLVGFMLTKKFSVGVGGTYLYTSKEYLVLPSNNRVRFDFSTYGARGFLRQNITERAFLQTEYESLNVEVPLNDGSGNTGREWVPGVFIGGGTFLPISTRLGMNISFFYNLAHDNLRSPYPNPIVIRGGLSFW